MMPDRDTFEFMAARPDRRRFGDDEAARPRRRSTTTVLTLELKSTRFDSIAVVDPAHAGRVWTFLPRSQIAFVHKTPTVIEVTLPTWLARDKGLI